jgi:hypothetical protein
MSSVQSALANQPRRQYISSIEFFNDIFSYTLTRNPTTNIQTGVLLANIVGANASTCPAGRILRENGQKLYPTVNPGVSTFMVGVIDTQTLLSGYIDPNSPTYAVYSTQLPVSFANGSDPNNGGNPDLGPPTYTGGIVQCSAVITTNDINSYGGIYAFGGQIASTTNTLLTPLSGSGALTAQTLNPALGEIFSITSAVGGGATITLDASIPTTIPTIGLKIILIITTTTAQNTVFTFGANMVSAGSLTTNGLSGKYTISFVSDGTQFYETSRTGTQA